MHPEENSQYSNNTFTLPKTKFSNWKGFKKITAPKTTVVYKLKDQYSLKEVTLLAHALQADGEVKDYKTSTFAYSISEGNHSAAVLIFNKKTGEFGYKASDGVALPQSNNTQQRIYDFLKRLDWYDPTLKIVATYKTHLDEDMTYYEIKRDWREVQLPILNAVGLLNLGPQNFISKLEPNDITSFRTNTTIYATSDHKDNRDRNDDFNTLTIGVSDATQNVTFINSNLRKIDSLQDSKASIIGYDEAVNRLKSNTYSSIFTIPSSVSNTTDWKKVFPTELAVADKATVSESSIAYIEESPTAEQKTLEPYYIFRGTALLTNNYQVNFVALVSALSKPQGQKNLPFKFAFIPPAFADDTSMKQTTFDLDITPSPPPTPTSLFAKCVPIKEELNLMAEMNSSNPGSTSRIAYGWSNKALIDGSVQTSKKGWWYYVPAVDTTENSLADDINQIFIQIRSITGIYQFRRFNQDPPPNILSDFRATGRTCPIRITGDSSTFIFPPDALQATPNVVFASCVPSANDLNPRYDQQVVYGWSPVGIINGQVRVSRTGWWYYVPASDTTEGNLKDDINQVESRLITVLGPYKFRKFTDDPNPSILADYRKTANRCPIRVTGDSPTIFVYAPSNFELTIQTPQAIYRDPISPQSMWNIRVDTDGRLTDGTVKKDYLYYEYSGVTFTKPKNGWKISAALLDTFIRENLSPKLGLNSRETERLSYEIHHGANAIHSPMLFIGMIDPDDVNKKLPLKVYPTPSVLNRLIFYVGSAAEETYPAPTVQPIERNDYMILEIGSYAEK